MSECKTPGCCECPNMTRCEGCGYTQHDKDYWLDHSHCTNPTTINNAWFNRRYWEVKEATSWWPKWMKK